MKLRPNGTKQKAVEFSLELANELRQKIKAKKRSKRCNKYNGKTGYFTNQTTLIGTSEVWNQVASTSNRLNLLLKKVNADQMSLAW
jgi:hypothetical protein